MCISQGLCDYRSLAYWYDEDLEYHDFGQTHMIIRLYFKYF
ncbi:hypothetical protein M6B38_232230 [Iris pallida]|uniref:Uncharacterized protein n=1 Tax=Iris pallida TaxID=29817 RepID=A0AAX6DRG2_IRIPA|nr:hypothetical protein M6B38_232230 [Iris pallida]